MRFPVRSALRSLALCVIGGVATAFTAFTALAQTGLQTATVDAQLASTDPTSAPMTLTLQDALQRAQANSPEFRTSLTELGIAQQDRVQGRAGLLPKVSSTAAFLYTQGNGSPAGRFIANNGVHEYIGQANVHQVFSPGTVAEYRRTNAALAVAKARAEIATRGLVVTVVQAYYGYVAAQRKYANVQQATAEASHFLDISQKLEKGGEVAHADVIKAQIQFQQQQRELREAQLEMNKSRLELAVLLFSDFNENFSVVDDLRLQPTLPPFQEVSASGGRNNPDLRAAVAALRVADQEVSVAWGGLLPSLSLDYFYGLDANQMAVRNPQGFRNVGYAATATLELPIWDWGASHSKVKQADLRRKQARVELSFAQRQLLANLRSFYDEAGAARSELELLSQSAELAAESQRLTTLRYQAGEASVLEVVDAQNTLTQTRNAYDDSQVRYRVALANLQKLTGSF